MLHSSPGSEPLGRWLRRFGELDPKRPLTHVMLNGGRASVPLAERGDGLLGAYAADVAAGRPLHVVECTMRGTYRMFADVDLKAPSGPEADALLAGVLGVALDAGSLPPQLRRGRALVCSRTWDAMDGKIGAHVVWEDVRVDDAAAAALRDRWVCAIAEGPFAGQGIAWWDRTIDRAVYRANGLRMPWSLKVGGRTVYAPTHAADFGTAGELEPIVPAVPARPTRDAALAWLRRASLMACAPGEPGSGVPPYGPAAVSPALEPSVAASDARRLADAGCAKAGAGAGGGRGRDGWAGRTLTAEEDEQIPGLPAVYRGRVTGVRLHRRDDGAVPGVATASLASRCCHIAGREHSHNHVYLVLHADGRVAQRCHSGACVGREHVLACRHALRPALRPREGNGGGNGNAKRTASASVRPSAGAAAATAYWLGRLGNAGSKG